MIGTALAHYLWVRWESGAKDCFLYDPNGKVMHTGEFLCIPTPSGTYVNIDVSKICAYKFFRKTIKVNLNPLEDEDHYDNPLN